jgi:hypothetical protein
MSKTELRLFKFVHADAANGIDERECANSSRFEPPRMSEYPKINAELSEINMEINNLRKNGFERPRAQVCFNNIVLGGGPF